MDNRASQSAGDAPYKLHSGDHELPQLIHVCGLRSHDHIIGAGDILRARHAWQARHRSSFADLGLDEDICLNHGVALRRRLLDVGKNETYRA